MTNPYQQQHGPGRDSLASTGLPPFNVRRPSYASVVSGTPSALTHLLNPSPDSEQHHPHQQQQLHASNLYSTAQNSRIDSAMAPARDGASAEEASSGDQHTLWPPRLGSHFPHFSRAFDLYLSKDPLLSLGLDGAQDVRFSSGNPVPNVSSTGFLSPSYLRGTVYLKKLEEKHRAKLLAEREAHASKGAQPGVSSAASSSPWLATSNGASSHLPVFNDKVSGSSHRGVSYKIVEKPTPPAEDDDPFTPLPSRWNKNDKEAALEVLGDGYEVRHTGKSAADHEASAVRADHHMPSTCGVYYFEITVLNKKPEKTPIAIGFTSRETSLSRAPGWEPESWGYHGDDGHCFASQNVGRPYEAKFGSGDTVGCLVNFRLGHALFTLNGRELKIAFKDIPFKDVKGKLYPIVGLKKKDDHIMVNFGQRPFMFDIDGYMKNQQEMISEEIRLADTSKLMPGLSETDLIQQLVLQFLQHEGYVETARAFAEELQDEKTALRLDPDEPIKGISIKDDVDANNRQRIRLAILEGDIDGAIKYTEAYYPTVLRDNEQVYFCLRCRKFIEMIRKEAELNMMLEEQRKKLKKPASQQRRQQQLGGDDQDEEMLEAGEEYQDNYNDDDADMAMAEDGADAPPAGLSELSQEALEYGMKLQAELQADPRREASKQLDEILSLIAYRNPLKVKEVAHLLDASGRVAVAEELNSAILTSLGKSSRAALENLYGQTYVLLEQLRRDGGDGAFVALRNVFDGIPPCIAR